MKRELKHYLLHNYAKGRFDCRAYPDEKGIETATVPCTSSLVPEYCRAYPDEKGIETLSISSILRASSMILQSLSR